MDKSLICEENAVICPWTYANWVVVCYTWESSMVNIWSTLPGGDQVYLVLMLVQKRMVVLKSLK